MPSSIAIAEALLQLTMIIMIGLYFIFSNTVMNVLSNNNNGAETMVSINKDILNPTFLLCFVISGLAGGYFFYFHEGLQSLSGGVFFVGTTLVTIFFNVPLNDKLKDAEPEKLDAVWSEYLNKWVFWNHIRTASGVLSGLLMSF